MQATNTVGDPPPGCTCGPFWSVVPPPPCPHHQIQPYTSPVIAAAWVCPRCQKMNAPHVSQCTCVPTTFSGTAIPSPFFGGFICDAPIQTWTGTTIDVGWTLGCPVEATCNCAQGCTGCKGAA